MARPPSKNPLTGKAPNSFTQATNRDLVAPTAVQALPTDQHRQKQSQKQRAKALRDRTMDAPEGYRLDAISPEYRTFATGANHVFPNTAAARGVPAIDQPHEVHPDITVQRRAEDLSGEEYEKGKDVLAQYGHPRTRAMASLKDMQSRALDRVSAEHIAAGVDESSSQLFYGGSAKTSIPDEHLQDVHDSGVRAAPDRVDQSVRSLATHRAFVNATSQMSHPERMTAARGLVAQAVSDTSPNNKWRDPRSEKTPWPNLDQADESISAALEDRPTQHLQGRPENSYKASQRAEDVIDSGDYRMDQFGTRTTKTGKVEAGAPKTVAFRGALIDKDSPDAYKVTDVHEAGVTSPWLPTAKAHKYSELDAYGGRKVVGESKSGTPKKAPVVEVHEDTPASAYEGLQPMRKTSNRTASKRGKVEVFDWGKSHAENMLARGTTSGGGIVHALNDRASREVLASRGLSRGTNYADNVHSFQAATWGSQQMRREDVPVSPADQYPVVRHWAGEGATVPKDASDPMRSMLRGDVHDNLSPQFKTNDRTGNNQSIWPEKS